MSTTGLTMRFAALYGAGLLLVAILVDDPQHIIGGKFIIPVAAAVLSLIWFYHAAGRVMKAREKVKAAIAMWLVEVAVSLGALIWLAADGSHGDYLDWAPVLAMIALANGLVIYFLIDLSSKFYAGDVNA